MTAVFSLIKPLFDALLQLFALRKAREKELLKEHVEPVFQAFETVHSKYLSSFAEYRRLLQASTEPAPSDHLTIEKIRQDNLFSDHERSRLVQICGASEDPQLAGFGAAIRDYLVDARVAQEPAQEYRASKFRNPQLWRRTLIAELENIFAERWQIVLDPACASPPLFGDDLEAALTALCREAQIDETSAARMHRIKSHLATKAIDEIVDEMQEAYARVASEYASLSVKLKHL